MEWNNDLEEAGTSGSVENMGTSDCSEEYYDVDEDNDDDVELEVS